MRLEQLLAALVLTAAVAFGSLRRRQIGACFDAVELDQHIAFLDLLAFLEVNGDDAIGDLGSDVDRFLGAHRTERFDLQRKIFELRVSGRDDHFARLSSALLGPGGLGARADSGQEDDGDSHDTIAIHEPPASSKHRCWSIRDGPGCKEW